MNGEWRSWALAGYGGQECINVVLSCGNQWRRCSKIGLSVKKTITHFVMMLDRLICRLCEGGVWELIQNAFVLLFSYKIAIKGCMNCCPHRCNFHKNTNLSVNVFDFFGKWLTYQWIRHMYMCLCQKCDDSCTFIYIGIFDWVPWYLDSRVLMSSKQ